MNKHGYFLLSWEKNILVINAKGPFNDEGALAGINKIKKFVSTKNLATWHKLGIWDEDSLGSPSAIKIVKNYHEWCVDNGCVKTAYVVHNSLQRSIGKNIYGSEPRMFSLESDARKWLAL